MKSRREKGPFRGGGFVPVQGVRLVADGHVHRPVGRPELVLLDQQRHRPSKDRRVVRPLKVRAHHVRQHGWLRPVEVVLPRSIGHKPKLIDKIEEVLDDVPRNADEATPGPQQALDDPVRVPVVRLAEAATGYHEAVIERQVAVRAVGAVRGRGAHVRAREVRPDVDDLLREFADDVVVDVVQPLRVRGEVRGGHLSKLVACLSEVLGQELLEGRVVLQGLLKPVEGGLDLPEGLLGGPAGV